MEIDDVIDAKMRSKKNSDEKIIPAGMFTKTCGRVIKIRPGPSPGFNPKEKTAGKIIKPAIRETSNWSIATINEALGRYSLLDKYELYVSIVERPIEREKIILDLMQP